MYDIGLLGLDSSHPETFATLLSDRDDATVAAVWDGGAVRPPEHTSSFCDRFDATQYDDPASMVDVVDAAMVLTVNWETHAPLAEPFLASGTPVFIDKPLAGSVADVETIDETAANGGARMAGGSAVPFHPSVSALESGTPEQSIFCAGYNDPFFYGVHVVETVRRLVASDWTSVAPAPDVGRSVVVQFDNGSSATIRLDGPESDPAFAVMSIGDRTEAVTIPSTEDELERMYRPFLSRFLEVVAGQHDARPRLVDGATLLLAVQAVLDHDKQINPDSPALRDVDMDGAAFLESYEPYY